MTVDALLHRLEGVRSCGRGWKARCPAHEDRNPSLSVHEGDRGILLRCWAGCSVNEICAAIGMTVRQMFFDDNGPVDRDAIRRYQTRRQAERTRQRARGKRIDALREAAAVIRAGTNLDISEWSDEQLDVALNRICDARELLEREGTDATQHKLVEA